MSTSSSTSSTLHYGGSLRAASSTTPGLSPAPARKPGRPSANTSFQAQKRFEMMVRMENAGIPESIIAPMLSISVPRLRYLKKSTEYLIVRMRITHGIILDADAKIAEIKSQRRELLVALLPPALQVVAETLLTKAGTYAERKLQVEVARDVLDRSEIFAKISRTEIKPVTFFDFEKVEQASSEVVAAMGSGSRKAALNNGSLAPEIQAAIATNKEFTKGSVALSSEAHEASLAQLEAESGRLTDVPDHSLSED